MKHVFVYKGKVRVALGLMQEEYIPLFLPWANWRIGIEGTLLRPPYSLASGIEWVRGLDKAKGKNEVFAVLLRTEAKRESYRYVGHMGVHNVQWPDGFATTGSVIGAKEARGHGVGTEAKLLLMYHSFMVLGLRKLISRVKVFNTQSAGHLIKCGYKPVGRFHKHNLHDGEYIDEILLEVFREDWEPIWEQYQTTGALPHLSDEQRMFVSELNKK